MLDLMLCEVYVVEEHNTLTMAQVTNAKGRGRMYGVEYSLQGATTSQRKQEGDRKWKDFILLHLSI